MPLPYTDLLYVYFELHTLLVDTMIVVSSLRSGCLFIPYFRRAIIEGKLKVTIDNQQTQNSPIFKQVLRSRV